MKNIVIVFVFFMSTTFALAQSVSLANPSIIGGPFDTVENEGQGVLSFWLVESSSSEVPESALGLANVTMSIDLSYVELMDADVSLLSGSLINYFDASYNEFNNIITLTQNSVIAGDASLYIEIPVVVAQNSINSQHLNGFNVNISAVSANTNAEGNASSFTYTKEVIDETAGINENEKNLDLLLYPNPVANILNISYDSSNNTDITGVTIYDAIGNLVYDNISVIDRKVNLSTLSSGIYYIRIFTRDSSTTKKIIKK